MIWCLFVPIIMFFTGKDLLIDSNFPNMAHEPRTFLAWVFAIVATLVISTLISIVPIVVGLIIGCNFKGKALKDKTYELISIKNKDGFQGAFYLTSGIVNSAEYYFWYRRNPDGAISGGKTLRDVGVEIFEGDYKPKMITYQHVYTNQFVRKYGWLYGIDWRDEKSYHPTFYLPEGTVDRTLKLD